MLTDAQLPLFRRRGGARRGAGRKPGPRPRVRHLPREALSGREPCHVTLKVVAGLRTLRDVRIVRALEATFRAVLLRADLRVVEYSLQDDHLHLLVEAADRRVLARGMKAIGTRTRSELRRALSSLTSLFSPTRA